ncbi:MAG: hypothetical protein IPI96_14395 [Saprospiraceae bacterium]|nr:hypothetical protein [Saprospiraceae bacterium]
MDKFIYIKYGLASAIGVRRFENGLALIKLYGGKFPITWSLGISAGLIVDHDPNIYLQKQEK